MHLKRLLCTVLMAILCISGFDIRTGSAESVKKAPVNIVLVYYFHGNFRCANCYNIERYTKEAVEKYFKSDLDSGRVVSKAINYEAKGNEHFVSDYQLYTKSVVLSLIKNGKEVKFCNLTRVWEYLRNKDAFHQYIKSEVEEYLKELS